MSQESFSAPPPDELQNITQIPSADGAAQAAASTQYAYLATADAPPYVPSRSVEATLALPSKTPGATTSFLPTAPATAPATPSATAAPPSSAPFGANVAATVGVGVGAAVGGNLLIALVIWVFVRRRRQRRNAAQRAADRAELASRDRRTVAHEELAGSSEATRSTHSSGPGRGFSKEIDVGARPRAADDAAAFELHHEIAHQLEDTSAAAVRSAQRRAMAELPSPRPP